AVRRDRGRSESRDSATMLRLHFTPARGDRLMRAPEILQSAIGFAAERLPLEKLSFHAMVQKKEVPLHRMSWAYYLGGLALFFFIIQVVTGLMLLFYYEPTVSDAHASV